MRSHLENPLCGSALPANGKPGKSPNLSLEMERGGTSLTLHGLEAGEQALLLVIGFGSVDLRDLFVEPEQVREVI